MDISERKIVDDLLLSYQEVGGINRIDSANLPSRPAIATLCEDLLQILFPGFLETEAIEAENLEKETAQLLSIIAIALEKEIKRSVRLLNEVNLKVKFSEAFQKQRWGRVLSEPRGHQPESQGI